jgi:hypothetical protein
VESLYLLWPRSSLGWVDRTRASSCTFLPHHHHLHPSFVSCPNLPAFLQQRHINGREGAYLGRWVFTGYVVGAQNFVGTWRALRSEDVGVPTWESAFTVSRRDD